MKRVILVLVLLLVLLTSGCNIVRIERKGKIDRIEIPGIYATYIYYYPPSEPGDTYTYKEHMAGNKIFVEVRTVVGRTKTN